MILTQTTPFTTKQIKKLRQKFETYIKTVIDVEAKICSAGADRHFESEAILLEQGSQQSHLWGGGIDVLTKEIDYNSFINIRPVDNNQSNEIIVLEIRNKFDHLMRYFFTELL